jgi:hypothetical protein
LFVKIAARKQFMGFPRGISVAWPENAGKNGPRKPKDFSNPICSALTAGVFVPSV